MNQFGPHDTLRSNSNLQVLINRGKHVTIICNDRRTECESFALPILDAFAFPTKVCDALKRLQPCVAGVQDWIDLTSTIANLYENGILVNDDIGFDEAPQRRFGFNSAKIHTAMLNDRVRTETIISGIQECVKPGDVVVDIGTGTGIFALAAARAGARHVYAIESGEMADVAEAAIAGNGLTDRITVLRGWSTQLTLPERADLLVTEIIGNEPLAERVLETIRDARKRFLKPGAGIIPDGIKIFGLPVEIPGGELGLRTFTAESADRWTEWYGFDLSSLQKSIDAETQMFPLRPHLARHWTAISKPVLLKRIDFASFDDTMVDCCTRGESNVDGSLNGVLVYFELEVGPHRILSTHPEIADKANHWSCMVWVLPNAQNISPGQEFEINYRYRVPGTGDRLEIAILNAD